jgi:hypothetical protein
MDVRALWNGAMGKEEGEGLPGRVALQLRLDCAVSGTWWPDELWLSVTDVSEGVAALRC